MSVGVDWTRLANAGLWGLMMAGCMPPAAQASLAAGSPIRIFVAEGPNVTVTTIPSNVASLTLPDGEYLFQAKFLYLTDSQLPTPISCNFPDGTRVDFIACSESNQILHPPAAYNPVDGYLLCAGRVRNGPVTVSVECSVSEGLAGVTILRPVFVAIPAALPVKR
jgi:hypothetical protein